MKPNPTTVPVESQTTYAAQNAQQGLINALDLSLLIGVEVAQLNKFAKMGSVAHYGEYHGKRFYNFQEIVNWLSKPDLQNDAKPIMKAKMEERLQKKDCPYTLGKPDRNQNVPIIWNPLS